MAKSSKHIVRTYHPVVRSELGLLLLPALVIGGLVWVLLDLQARTCTCETGELLSWWHWAGAIGLPMLWVIAAFLKTQVMRRYRVTLDSVQAESGLIRRDSTEMRLRDVRHIDVHQGLVDRLFAMGDVAFATETDGGTRVVFHNVHKPKDVRAFVKDLLDRMKDGALREEDVAGLIESKPPATVPDPKGSDESAPDSSTPKAAATRPARRSASSTPEKRSTAPMTGARSPSGRDAASGSSGASSGNKAAGEGNRDELYRLLAQQEAEGKAGEESDE